MHARATIGFGFTSDWLKKWRENFEQLLSEVDAKPKQLANYFQHSIENRSIQWIVIYPVNSVINILNNWGQGFSGTTKECIEMRTAHRAPRTGGSVGWAPDCHVGGC